MFRVSGHSMMPSFKPNDKVLASSIPYLFNSPKKGDIIVFKYKGKFLMKKISKVDGEGFMVEGENKSDSLNIGKIRREEILGKLIKKV